MKTNFETLVDVVIQAEKAGRPRHELVLEVCHTPAVLAGVGLALLPVALKAKAIGKMFFDHAMTQGQIERIPAMLENPKAIYMSDTQPPNVVVLTFELVAGAPIIIPVARSRQVGRNAVVNEVLSMYAKTGPNPEPRWRAQGLLLWEP